MTGKAELLKRLRQFVDEDNLERLTVLEINALLDKYEGKKGGPRIKKDLIAGISGLRKEMIQMIAKDLGCDKRMVKDLNKGELLLQIREITEGYQTGRRLVALGRFQGQPLTAVLQDTGYSTWVLKELPKSTHPLFRELATLIRLNQGYYQKLSQEMKAEAKSEESDSDPPKSSSSKKNPKVKTEVKTEPEDEDWEWPLEPPDDLPSEGTSTSSYKTVGMREKPVWDGKPDTLEAHIRLCQEWSALQMFPDFCNTSMRDSEKRRK